MTVADAIHELAKHPRDAKVIGEGFVLGIEELVKVAYNPGENQVVLIGENR